MVGEEKRNRRDSTRKSYERGLPGYHDPVSRYFEAEPARSALTLRLWLAGFGVVFCTVAAILVFTTVHELAWAGWALFVLAVVGAVDFGWIVYRKWRGEPG